MVEVFIKYIHVLSKVTIIITSAKDQCSIWFSLVWFYGTSTIVGHLMPNPLYTYVLSIYDLVWLGCMVYQWL